MPSVAQSTWVHTVVFSEVRVTQTLVFCKMFSRSLLVLFILGIVLPVLLITCSSDYLPLLITYPSLLITYPFWLPTPLVSWALYCLFFWLPTPLVSWALYCLFFWLPTPSDYLPLWYLQTFLADYVGIGFSLWSTIFTEKLWFSYAQLGVNIDIFISSKICTKITI
jgi:hypothetical protein